VFTHGMEIGVSRNESHDLKTATDELIQAIRQSNQRLGAPKGYERASVGGQDGLHAVLSNVSDVTGAPEVIEVYTAQLRDGSMFYALAVAPRALYGSYSPVFANVVGSIQFVR
jgi:hypothetical protein